ncbi:putative aldouronate transport system permease protein [Paenibacillus sp. UNCCL117]|uniref:ABC transporter permease n=1 Tax=unclassified Paenibacillus TaxID=185978 RepID=UPI0008890FB4|nr:MULTISPECIES: ABC transporter permease subunit [unclassified Paenibacillus]SDC94679.1 putative aldouronate transport system permease protein [Paenibacillus sp. cl123]SFW29869.1 putative aldouronate transport system permease protein [Paenibacillus sp. UNCCL117]
MNEGRELAKWKFRKNVVYENAALWLLALPTVVLLFIFNYIPMGGLIVAFKDYRYNLGILGSEWIGFQNFAFFLNSLDAWRITRNTLLYGITFIIVGIFFAVLIALLLYEVKNKLALKFFQTTMTIPRFLSWVIVSYITYLFLSPTQGVLNDILTGMGLAPVMWFNEVKAWPFIIVLVNLWKHIGLDCIMYYALLMGIDSEQFEAAKIDGANRFQQALHISLPALMPLMIILGILQLANIFRGDFGLFFQIPRDVGLLYPATDIIDTYVFRGLRGGDIGPAAAVGFFQSVVGLITVVIANAAVKKISPQNSLY